MKAHTTENFMFFTASVSRQTKNLTPPYALRFFPLQNWPQLGWEKYRVLNLRHIFSVTRQDILHHSWIIGSFHLLTSFKLIEVSSNFMPIDFLDKRMNQICVLLSFVKFSFLFAILGTSILIFLDINIEITWFNNNWFLLMYY